MDAAEAQWQSSPPSSPSSGTTSSWGEGVDVTAQAFLQVALQERLGEDAGEAVREKLTWWFLIENEASFVEASTRVEIYPRNQPTRSTEWQRIAEKIKMNF